MAQVVTSENMAEYIQTGKVAEFKPPTAEAEVPRETKDSEVTAPAEAPKGEEDDLPDGVKAKVDKIVNKKHKEMKEAEEFAEREYNQRRAAEKQADQFKADRDALAARLAEYEQKSRPAVVEEAPKQSDFATVDEYLDAKTNYLVDQKIKQREEAEKQRIANEKARQVQNEFAKSIDDAMKKYPDFQEVTEGAEIELPQHMTQYLLESDSKAELGYHLSKMYRDTPDELNRLLKLSPIRAIAELGKLEAGLSKPQKAEAIREAPVSKAPAPITPIEGKTAPVNTDLNRDMSYSEYKRLKAQQAGKR